MRMLPVVVALAVAAASPAFGATKKKAPRHKPVVTRSVPAAAARADRAQGNPAWNVYRNGFYVGSDPDPRVRAKLYGEDINNEP